MRFEVRGTEPRLPCSSATAWRVGRVAGCRMLVDGCWVGATTGSSAQAWRVSATQVSESRPGAPAVGMTAAFFVRAGLGPGTAVDCELWAMGGASGSALGWMRSSSISAKCLLRCSSISMGAGITAMGAMGPWSASRMRSSTKSPGGFKAQEELGL